MRAPSISRRSALTGAALASAALALGACGGGGRSGSKPGTLRIMTNAISGGKNAAEATWIEQWVIPGFKEAQKSAGKEVDVVFEAQGVDDEDYKTKTALDFQIGRAHV